MDTCLRTECQSLLEQLKKSQELMRNGIKSQNHSQISTQDFECDDPIQAFYLSRKGKRGGTSNFGKDLTGLVNVSSNADTDLKPTYARSKLSSLTSTGMYNSTTATESYKDNDRTLSKDSSEKENDGASKWSLGKYSSQGNRSAENTNYSAISSLPNSAIPSEICDGDSIKTFKDNYAATSSSWQPATPSTQRRRQMINRHIDVPTKLDQEELRDLDNERRLNFSYSHINVDYNVKSLISGAEKAPTSQTSSATLIDKDLRSRGPIPLDEEQKEMFQRQLVDDGNNRKLNNFVKEASIKPKSILNSSAYYSLNSSKRNNSRVRFSASQSLEEPVQQDHRLLGYDWIAALLDNEPHLNNQSESFFDDIKDFRKAYKDECSNQFYMESPYTLVESEPQPVVDALTEPKVRPYVVNERLFTEPFRPDLIDYEEDSPNKKDSKEPTAANPRFVRVSIPRSTLQTPYRVKPHRRGSFDAADSCSLMDHCLLGWENSRPAMLPTAQTVDLNTEAGTRVDSEKTTLAEAERLANLHNRAQWPFAKPTPRQRTLPTWQKQYMNTTLNLSTPGELSQTIQTGFKPANVKRVTDKLLSSTYSTMYEMERLRQERALEKKRVEEEERKK